MRCEPLPTTALDPYLASAHCWLGYVLYQEGQLESATDHWTLAMRLDPTSPHASAGVALSQLKHGQEEEAVRTYEKALTYDHRFADSKFLESDKGPKWSGQLLLQDFEMLLAKVPKPSYPSQATQAKLPKPSYPSQATQAKLPKPSYPSHATPSFSTRMARRSCNFTSILMADQY